MPRPWRLLRVRRCLLWWRKRLMKKNPYQLLKDLWVLGSKDPAFFLRTFAKNEKNQPYDPASVPAQIETINAFLTGDYDQLYIGGGNSGGKTALLIQLGIWAPVWKKYPKEPRRFTNLKEFKDEPYNVLCTGHEQKHSNELWEKIMEGF